jgi:hypothetical protein
MSWKGAIETQNIAVVRRDYEAFAKGVRDALRAERNLAIGEERDLAADLVSTVSPFRSRAFLSHWSPERVDQKNQRSPERRGYRPLVFQARQGVVTEVKEFRYDPPRKLGSGHSAGEKGFEGA